jgi:hypothetical protein
VQNVSTTPVTRKSTISQLSTAVYADNAGFAGLASAASVSGTDNTLVTQSGNNRKATVSQVATAVLADNTAITALPNASSISVTDTTVVAQSGTNREATIAQISAAVYADNAALVGLPNVASVANTDTLVVAQSGTNKEATMIQVATNVFTNNTALAARPTFYAEQFIGSDGVSQYGANNLYTYPINNARVLSSNTYTSTTYSASISAALYSTTQLITTCLNIPLSTVNSYGLFTVSADYFVYFTDMFAIIQSSRFATAGGAPSAKPATGSAAKIKISTIANYPNGDTYLNYDLLNFNTTTYGANSGGTVNDQPVFKVPLKYTRGSATANFTASVTFTGYILGNILTVVIGPTGTNQRITPGMTLSGGAITSSTVIVEQLTDTSGSGFNGGAGTYLINNSQTVASSGSPISISGIGTDSNMIGNRLLMNTDSSNSTSGVILDIVNTNYTSGAIDVLIFGSPQIYRG